MQILDVLVKAQGGQAIGNLAKTYGIEPAQAEAALKAVVPELTRYLERNTLSRGGLADLVGALGNSAHEKVLDTPAALNAPAVRQDGNAILGHILGSKDASRAVAARAAASTGLSEEIIKQLLPIIASMVMGGLSRASKGALDDILGKIPGLGDAMRQGLPGGGGSGQGGGLQLPTPQSPTPQAPTPQMQPAPAPRPSAGGSPLPLPGEGPVASGPNPFDDLSDIIRKGGTSIPGQGGGTLGTIIRSILGGILGFQSRGFIGWLVRLIVMRWGWGLVRTILSRIFLRR